MGTPIDDFGGPAFPAHDLVDGIANQSMHGMSLRDYMAGQALTGWIASRPLADGASLANTSVHAEAIAIAAYAYADAMLAARKENP